MFHQPRQRHRAARAAAHPRQCVQFHHDALDAVVLLRRQQAPRAVRQQAAGERTPSHRREALGETLVERAVGEGAQVREADFHLIHEERKGQRVLQSGELRRPEVAHAELAHLALLPELVEGNADFVRVHQPVGPVKLIEVNRLHAQPPQ